MWLSIKLNAFTKTKFSEVEETQSNIILMIFGVKLMSFFFNFGHDNNL